MPRLRLKPLAAYSYSVELIVRITDLNYGGHLGNDRLLSLVHEARAAFLKQYGFSETDCGGVALTMADASLVYQQEAYGGDVLRFEVAAGEPTRYGFRLFYRTTRPEDGAKIALVETGMVCFDYGTKRIIPMPAAFKDSGILSA